MNSKMDNNIGEARRSYAPDLFVFQLRDCHMLSLGAASLRRFPAYAYGSMADGTTQKTNVTTNVTTNVIHALDTKNGGTPKDAPVVSMASAQRPHDLIQLLVKLTDLAVQIVNIAFQVIELFPSVIGTTWRLTLVVEGPCGVCKLVNLRPQRCNPAVCVIHVEQQTGVSVDSVVPLLDDL